MYLTHSGRHFSPSLTVLWQAGNETEFILLVISRLFMTSQLTFYCCILACIKVEADDITFQFHGNVNLGFGEVASDRSRNDD